MVSRIKSRLFPSNKEDAGLGRLVIIGHCSEEEVLEVAMSLFSYFLFLKVNQLECFPDKTCIISLWIQEALTRLVVRGLIKVGFGLSSVLGSSSCKVPPPIVSRCYQEISTGMLGYNQALKVK